MKSSIIYFIFLISYCYCEKLLGGWSTSDDASLKYDCLNKALTHISGEKATQELHSQASDHICKTQIVNGLNIKCSFVLRGEKWECSFYKSFVQTLEIQLDECKKVEDEQKIEEKDDEEVAEDLETANEGDINQQQLVADENQEADDESSPINDGEGQKEDTQDSLKENDDEEDDEAEIDSINKKISQEFSNDEEIQQQ